jgi:hypothetical protein
MNLFTKEIDKKLFAQYLKGSDLENQVVVAKIFNPYGRGNWYIINSDPSDPNYLWAIVDLVEVEVGSVSRNELENIKLPPFRLGLERDMYFEPINAAELYRGLRAGKTYAEGGEISIEAQNKDMLLNYAEELEHHVKEFEEAAKGAEKVMPWVIAKIERASTDLSDVTHYLASENEKRREYGDGEGEEEYADGGFIKWQDAKIGDSARVKSENKMGVILKDYGRKFHLKFVNGTEKTYDASELEFIKDEYADGGEIDNYKNLSSQIEKLDKKLKSLENINSKEAYDESQKLIETRSFLLAKMLHEEDKLTGEREGERRAGMDEEFAKGGELTVKIGDRVRQRKKVGSSVVYGIDGIVYETDGITFKLKDKYGNKSDRLYLTSSFKKSEIKSMADGGGTQSLDDIYKDLDNKRTKIRLKIATIVGLDDALEYLNRDFVVSPFRLIEKAVNSGFLTIDEIDKNLWDAATEEAYDIDSDYRDSGEAIGSSDMNAFVSRMLKSAGINIEVVNNRYQRMADGGKVKFADKVASIKSSLLERKKVSPKVQKDYGKTYSPKEAEESAKRIVGAMTAKERLMSKRKKK